MTEPMSNESTKLNANQEAQVVLKADIRGTEREQVSRWWQSLSESQRQEWLAIEWGWRCGPGGANGSAANVSRDWIEERGGERRWWDCMYVSREAA